MHESYLGQIYLSPLSLIRLIPIYFLGLMYELLTMYGFWLSWCVNWYVNCEAILCTTRVYTEISMYQKGAKVKSLGRGREGFILQLNEEKISSRNSYSLSDTNKNISKSMKIVWLHENGIANDGELYPNNIIIIKRVATSYRNNSIVVWFTVSCDGNF